VDDAEDERLDSWKEIAAHFRRSVRTVQNWERGEGLPVHRHRHKKLGSVYALRVELDAWWQIHEQRVDPPPPQTLSTYKVLIGLALAGAAGVLYFGLVATPQPPTSRSGDDSSRRSPRGDATAYHSDESGNFDIWVKRTDGGTSTNLTVDHPGTDKNPSWSPDGTRIAFFSDREGGGYFTVSSTGGPARRVPGWDASTLGPPVWSPDGAALAWVSSRSSETAGRTEAFVHIHSIEEGGVRVLPIPDDSDWRFDLSWSPDGHRLHLLQQRAGAVDLKEQR
jgi:hypothetical protein